MGKLEYIASAIVILTSGEAAYITGKTMIMDSGSSTVDSAALLYVDIGLLKIEPINKLMTFSLANNGFFGNKKEVPRHQ